MNYPQILEFAKETVLQAGQLALELSHDVQIFARKDFGDLYTNADDEVNKLIKSKVLKAYPKFGFISEEDEGQIEGEDGTWILDPIDGTKYFAMGIPLYTISLALQVSNALVLGVVYAPGLGQMFSAVSEGGAFLNDEQVRCTDVHGLKNVTLFAEIPNIYSPSTERKLAMEKLDTLVSSTERTRIMGIASLGLCWTAMGAFGAYVNLGSSTKIWDVAGGRVILSEAGGVFSEIDGTMIAGPKHLHNELRSCLNL